jgi:predicted MFS family arabinose efflux permease
MPDTTKAPQEKRLIDTFAMFIVALLSLVLLIYVAYGEAKRTYEQFQIQKLVSQGQIVQSAVEGFVRPGFPIQQFVGFNSLAEPMAKADDLLDSISAHDMNGNRIFAAGDQKAVMLTDAGNTVRVADKSSEIRRLGEMLQVILPVRNRFEQVGHVVLSIKSSKLTENVDQAFKPVLFVGLAAALVFALYVFVFAQRFPPSSKRQFVAAGFAMTFVSVAVVVVSTLISVYSEGAQARTKSLADSLGQRLDDLVIYNINLDDVTGIISLFGDYKRLNPDIRAAALLVDGKVRAHVDPTRRNVDWDHVEGDYEYTVRISPDGYPREVIIKVALPQNVVFQQVSRSVKNFAALFVASAFFAALFMGLARSLQLLAQVREGAWSRLEEQATIDLVKPVFFLAVFVEHLSYAFLPSLIQTYVTAAGLPISFGSLPFVIYYLSFAAALVPAGRLETRIGARGVILLGLVLAATGLTMMVLFSDFWIVTLARGLAGLGQGILFIGVQAYVLANSSQEHRTQAGSAIVFGFQAGMIAGMAIGSLLVSYVGSQGIFQIGASIAFITSIYGWLALPKRLSGGGTSESMNSAWRNLRLILSDGGVARAVFLIGVPAKAVLTGVVLFAMPLLLSQQGYLKEDIGQITMLYAGAVIASSHFASKRADKARNTEKILFQGSFLTAIGLIVISMAGVSALVNWNTNSGLGTFLIIVGVIIVGLAHGFINAPIVTHVVETKISAEIGSTNVASAYRLLERLGHIVGPLIMGQIFAFSGISWTVLFVIGVAILVMGALFLSPVKTVQSENETSIAR